MIISFSSTSTKSYSMKKIFHLLIFQYESTMLFNDPLNDYTDNLIFNRISDENSLSSSILISGLRFNAVYIHYSQLIWIKK